jgi:hypothetical protein
MYNTIRGVISGSEIEIVTTSSFEEILLNEFFPISRSVYQFDSDRHWRLERPTVCLFEESVQVDGYL